MAQSKGEAGIIAAKLRSSWDKIESSCEAFSPPEALSAGPPPGRLANHPAIGHLVRFINPSIIGIFFCRCVVSVVTSKFRSYVNALRTHANR